MTLSPNLEQGIHIKKIEYIEGVNLLNVLCVRSFELQNQTLNEPWSSCLAAIA